VGEQIVTHQGYFVPFSQFLNLITSSHLADIQQTAMPSLRQEMADEAELRQESGERGTDFSDLPEMDDFEHYVKQLEAAETIDAVKATLHKMVDHFTPDESYGTIVFDYERYRGGLDIIQSISGVVLPLLPEAIRFFHTACTQGSGCMGEPVLAFKLDELLETKMTDSGESLAKLLNMPHIKPMIVVELSPQANPSKGHDEHA